MNPVKIVKGIKTLKEREKELLQNVLGKTDWDFPKAIYLL